MCLIFLLSLPLLNPWVRGDGVGYYAPVRAPRIEQRLDFTQDYQHAHPSFRVFAISAWMSQANLFPDLGEELR